MRLELKPALGTIRRLHPTIARIAGIFAGLYLMGTHAFLAFYFVHLLLKSLKALFLLDGSIIVSHRVRKNSTIKISYFTFLTAAGVLSSLLVSISYLGSLFFFDRMISSDTIDMTFAQLYALTIVSNLIVPFAGVVRARASLWVRAFIFRGQHLMKLLFIAAFFVLEIDGALLPYVWLATSLIVSSLMLVVGLFHFMRLGPRPPSWPIEWYKIRLMWQRMIGHSARHTNNRATFLATKGVVSAFLGPFAGLALKSIRFDNEARRRRYVARIKDRDAVNRLGGRIPNAVKRGLAEDQPFWIVTGLALLILGIVVVLRGTLDALLLLGLLMVVSKMLSVSLRLLVLNWLMSMRPSPGDGSAP